MRLLLPARRIARRGLPPVAALLALSLALALPRCAGQNALLLTLGAKRYVRNFTLKVKDLATNKLVLDKVGERIDPTDINRDISKPGKELKLAIEFERPGNYLVYILGDSGDVSDRQYAIHDYQVDGVREERLTLVPLDPALDKDGDGFPACPDDGDCSNKDTPSVVCRFLDCVDDPSASLPNGGTAAGINPMASEICGNKLDDDCSGGCVAKANLKALMEQHDEPCIDRDGDGVPQDRDCDDNDPCRSPNLHEGANLCCRTLGIADTDPRCKNGKIAADSPYWELPVACQEKLNKEGRTMTPPYCDDKVDQDCSGQDVKCETDDDCDGYPPPVDCNDKDPSIHPGAPELCDGKDNNCNGVIDEGCVPCDVDGDGHASPGSTDPNCKDAKGNPLPKDDSDDYDTGINPETTASTNGAEGGTVLGALRGYCSYDTKKDKNGLRPRDVDHDGDGKPAKDDGCPPENCDEDGDGFPGPQCNPPKSIEDCNDKDPTVFPGAPDICGDGILQNCVADTPCSACTDADQDGYCAPPAGCEGACRLSYDCDDSDPAIHPWETKDTKAPKWQPSTEVCDHKDNDCDGLVDEGNPDPSGALMPTTSKTCNDDNEGMCACPQGTTAPCDAAKKAASGVCACSPIKPNSARHDGNRMACPGENLGAPASPRCFGATQPDIERCEVGDYNCDGHDVLAGEVFNLKGQICGTATGNCTLGHLTDCDLTKSMANLPQIQAIDANFVKYPHLVCDGQMPFSEVCNGLNDLCTSNQAPANEVDTDGDKFIACWPCSTNDPDPRRNLAAGLLGCGDCNPGNGSIYPGAPEMCNLADDNCSGALNDDGKDDCKLPWQKCCAGKAGCKQTDTDFSNCGDCGVSCDSGVASQCVGGKCVCGSTGDVCKNGLNCMGSGASATCQCIQGGLCPGCCGGGACNVSPSTGSCGKSGSACQDCDDKNECTTDSCTTSTGQCAHSNLGSTVACASGSGKCRSGNCCTGCWNGTCQPGNTIAACGSGGNDCNGCSGATCKSAVCNAGGQCGTTDQTGTSCTVASKTGTCKSGSCCTDCWAGSVCHTPDNSYCGTAGAACGTCSGSDECHSPDCSSGTCQNSPLSGTDCASGSGKCRSGSCCSGTKCWNTSNSQCIAPIDSACGTGGAVCASCQPTGTCRNGSCCSGTNCWNGSACVTGTTDGICGRQGGSCIDCGAAPGSCHGGNCCSGNNCWNGLACVAGTADGACGKDGVDCSSCTPGGTCRNYGCCSGSNCWNGSACVAGTSNSVCGKSGGNCSDCGSGTCRGGSCCSGSNCWNGTSCVASSDTACGKDGGNCSDCTPGGTCHGGDCCSGNNCWNGATCVAGNSDTACGKDGQSCKACVTPQTCKSFGCAN
jgi:hypothetical protein